MRKHIITISGNIASGKSEVSKILSESLNYEVYKASEEFRHQARKANMTLVDFNEYIKDNPEVDIYVDNCIKNNVNGKKNIIVDARLGFHLVDDAFDVYLKADIDKASERLFVVAKERGKEEEYSSVGEAKAGIIRREKSERKRYLERYAVDITDMSNYTCVIDTTNISSQEVAQKIIEEYNKWKAEED